MARRRKNPPVCPKCGFSDAVVPVGYGYPAPETMKAAERGEIILGGCVVGDIDPRHACRRCRVYFDFWRPERAAGVMAQRGWIEEGDDERCRWPWFWGEERKQVNDG